MQYLLPKILSLNFLACELEEFWLHKEMEHSRVQECLEVIPWSNMFEDRKKNTPTWGIELPT